MNLVDTEYIRRRCDIEEGIRYLDDDRLRKIIHNLYKNKVRGRLIYITATAVCHLADQYGQKFLALPFAIGDFGLTAVYQTIRKGVVTILLGSVGPLFIMGSPLALVGAFVLGTSGLRLAFTSLDFIPTSVISSGKDAEPRMPGVTDVIVVNNQGKIHMNKPVKNNPECWLPDQHVLNPNCEIQPTELTEIGDIIPEYKDIVNMQDVTGLDQTDFTYIYDLGQTKGKEVNFLDKFGDLEPIDKNEVWDTYKNEIPIQEKRYLRTRNKL